MIKRTAMGIIFSNMHDNHLGSLTRERTTGSVPFGGRYRLVDFVLSSMVNSGVSEVRCDCQIQLSNAVDLWAAAESGT